MILFLSCADDSDKSAGDVFFKSESYFDKEASRLSAANIPIQKSISRNSETESARIVNPDWPKELEPFRQCNISKPSLRNSYRQDSISSGNTRRIRYTALEPRLAIRQLEVESTNGRIVRILFSTSETNQLYSTSRQLLYLPDSGYKITGMQQMAMGEKTDYSVTATWK